MRPTSRTSWVWCTPHNQQLERESKQRRQYKERATTSSSTPTIRKE
jgi:hypothetical protein